MARRQLVAEGGRAYAFPCDMAGALHGRNIWWRCATAGAGQLGRL